MAAAFEKLHPAVRATSQPRRPKFWTKAKSHCMSSTGITAIAARAVSLRDAKYFRLRVRGLPEAQDNCENAKSHQDCLSGACPAQGEHVAQTYSAAVRASPEHSEKISGPTSGVGCVSGTMNPVIAAGKKPSCDGAKTRAERAVPAST